MARDEFRVELTADNQISKEAKKAGQDLDKIPDKVETELELSGVDKVIGALEDVTAEAKAVAEAADVLGRALGPELAAQADTTRIVGDLQQMGLTLDDIKGEADTLAAALKEAADADVGGKMGASLGTARGKIDEMSDSARGANSALANMIGNSAQDIGALGGLAGSAGVAIGQIAEYAADASLGGEKLGSALKSMAGVVGPMAALGVAIQLLNSAMQASAASRAFDAANVDQYVTALKEGTDAVTSFNDEIRETGELQFRSQVGGGPLGMFSSTQDLLPVLEKAGMTVADFNTILAEYVAAGDGSADMNDRWQKTLEDQGVSMLDAIDILRAVNQETDARVAAGEKVVRVEELTGEAVADTAAIMEDAKDVVAVAGEAMGTYAAEAQAAADAVNAQVDALNAQADALNAQVDAALAAADQQLAVNAAFAEFGEVLGDSEASANDVRDSAIDLAKATSELKTEQANANGVTLTSTQRLDNQNNALLETARTASGPAQSAILDYVAAVNDIPESTMTDIRAAIARGDIDEANRLLADASRPRKAAVNADANTAQAERDLNWLARPREAMVQVRLQGATGGFGGAIVTAGTTSAPAPAGMAVPVARAAPTQTINVSLNAAVIGDRYEVQRTVARAIRGATRIGGARLARAEAT